ncbi:MAG: hypothetical protein HQL76_15560 [Magnetococcales bacterium]|nr:hypothetical protein [Magnetococcales bacterium]
MRGPGWGVLIVGCVAVFLPLVSFGDGTILGGEERRDRESVSLGRLFTTSRERIFLDRARRRVLALERVSDGASRREDRLRTERVSVEGVLLRSAGPPAVWMNGVSAMANAEHVPDGILLEGEHVPRGAVAVRLPYRGLWMTLWAGQRYEGGLGRVLEGFEVGPAMAEKNGLPRKAGVGGSHGEGGAREAAGGGQKERTRDTKAFRDDVDRHALGADGAALSEMMKDRARFQDNLEGLRSILGR